MKLEKNNLHLIGYVHSVQGVKGQLFVVIMADDLPWIGKWNRLILSQSESSVQYSVYKISERKSHHKQGKQGFILSLEEISDRNLAEELKGHSIWIPKDFVISKEGESIFLHEIMNFTVIDDERGEVGVISGVESGGVQDMIQIDTKNGIYDVPLVKAFIKKIDFAQNKIFMDIPQGLLEEL